MALGCNNQSTKRRDLNFYRLPLKNEELLTRWLVNLRKPKLPKLLENCYVCSDHFELSCFGRDIKVRKCYLFICVAFPVTRKSQWIF